MLTLGLLAPGSARGEAMGTLSVERPGPSGAAEKPPAPSATTAPPTLPPTAGGGTVPPAAPVVKAAASPEVIAPAISKSAETSITPPTALELTPPFSPEPMKPVAGSELELMPIRPMVANDTMAAGSETPKPAVSSPWTNLYSVGQVLGAMAIVLGLIFIARALLRKFVPGAAVGSGKGVLEILARYPLAKTQSLVLVRIGSQIVVLNQGKESSQSVLVISDPNEVATILGQIQGAQPNSIQAGFSSLLNSAQSELESSPATERGEDLPDEGLGANRPMAVEGDLDAELEEMSAARRQLMELRQSVRSVRDRLA